MRSRPGSAPKRRRADGPDPRASFRRHPRWTPRRVRHLCSRRRPRCCKLARGDSSQRRAPCFRHCLIQPCRWRPAVLRRPAPHPSHRKVENTPHRTEVCSCSICRRTCLRSLPRMFRRTRSPTGSVRFSRCARRRPQSRPPRCGAPSAPLRRTCAARSLAYLLGEATVTLLLTSHAYCSPRSDVTSAETSAEDRMRRAGVPMRRRRSCSAHCAL